jgi:hypothetical protein
MSSSIRSQARLKPNRDPTDDSWVDRVADSVQELLAAEGLEMELVVWYDPLCETLHSVGFDGSPARYFRSLATESEASSTRSNPEAPAESSTAAPAPDPGA